MSLQCQRDSYLKRFATTVLSCDETEASNQKVYEVVLQDTVLFPEGGGQVIFLCHECSYVYALLY